MGKERTDRPFTTMTQGDVTSSIDAIAARVPFNVEPEDYKQDGLWYCGKCNTPKQCQVEILGRTRIFPLVCKCEGERRDKIERKRRAAEERLKIEGLRAAGLQDKSLREDTFEIADGRNAKIMRTAERYCSRFEDVYKANTGLLLWGNTGNGKTFTMACIANRLIDRGVPVLVTEFPRVLSALSSLNGEDRYKYIESINRFKLLVVDDLGTERGTSYGLEQVNSVIDIRYKSGKPMIISTNLTLKEMQDETDIDYARIYDRVLEMCVPIHFEAESFRPEKANKKKEALREILRGEK